MNEPRCTNCPDALQVRLKHFVPYCDLICGKSGWPTRKWFGLEKSAKIIVTAWTCTLKLNFYVSIPTNLAVLLKEQSRGGQWGRAGGMLLQGWIQSMAAYVKSIDSNHLLSIGSEGFYGINDVVRSNYANPQGPNTWVIPQLNNQASSSAPACFILNRKYCWICQCCNEIIIVAEYSAAFAFWIECKGHCIALWFLRSAKSASKPFWMEALSLAADNFCAYLKCTSRWANKEGQDFILNNQIQVNATLLSETGSKPCSDVCGKGGEPVSIDYSDSPSPLITSLIFSCKWEEEFGHLAWQCISRLVRFPVQALVPELPDLLGNVLAWQEQCSVIPDGTCMQNIDFATVHLWADNWQDDTTTFQTNWLQQHDADGSRILRKPVSSSPYQTAFATFSFRMPTWQAIQKLWIWNTDLSADSSFSYASTVQEVPM